jgi:predicted Zn-dependent protease
MIRAATNVWLLLCFLFFISSPAVTETFSHEDGGIEFDVPDEWNVEVSDEVLTISTPDGTVVFTFWVPEADNWQDAVDAVSEELESLIEDANVTHEGESELNGMPMYEVSGTGKVKGTSTEWSFSLILAKKPVILLVLSNSDKWEKNRPVVKRFADSIRLMD